MATLDSRQVSYSTEAITSRKAYMGAIHSTLSLGRLVSALSAAANAIQPIVARIPRWSDEYR